MFTRELSSRGRAGAHFFLLGRDYHLGDLLWLTPVLAEYRRQIEPNRLLVGLPDRPISAILECNPVIEELARGDPSEVLANARSRFGHDLILHDLRMFPVAVAMIRDWRYHLPWLYYRDLWMEDRGQWLATHLHLGLLTDVRPILELEDRDLEIARTLPERTVVLAPHVGHYTIPLLDRMWQRIKGWPWPAWAELAERLQRDGYTPITLGAVGQDVIPGTVGMMGLPIRQAAGIIDRSSALVTGESGLWFVAAARATPFAIVPWWLPRSLDWAARMGVPYRLIYREDASVDAVLARVRELTHAAWV